MITMTTATINKPKRTTRITIPSIRTHFGIWGKPLGERPVLIHRSLVPGYMRHLPKKRLEIEGKKCGMMVVQVN